MWRYLQPEAGTPYSLQQTLHVSSDTCQALTSLLLLPSISFGEIEAPDVSNCVAGTHDDAITNRFKGMSRLDLIKYFIPLRPDTLAISCGSQITDVVPRGRTALAYSGTESIELSIWTWASIKPGKR